MIVKDVIFYVMLCYVIYECNTLCFAVLNNIAQLKFVFFLN